MHDSKLVHTTITGDGGCGRPSPCDCGGVPQAPCTGPVGHQGDHCATWLDHVDRTTVYVICGTCFYEKVQGEPCGLPCV